MPVVVVGGDPGDCLGASRTLKVQILIPIVLIVRPLSLGTGHSRRGRRGESPDSILGMIFVITPHSINRLIFTWGPIKRTIHSVQLARPLAGEGHGKYRLRK